MKRHLLLTAAIGVAALIVPETALAAHALEGGAASQPSLPAIEGDVLINGLAAAASLPLGLLVFLAGRGALRRLRSRDLNVRRKVRVPAGRLTVTTHPSQPVPPYQGPDVVPPAGMGERLRERLGRLRAPTVRLPVSPFGNSGVAPEDDRLAWLHEGEALQEAGLLAEAEWKFQYGLDEAVRHGWVEEIGIYERALTRLAAAFPAKAKLTPVTATRPAAREQEIANVLARVAAQREQLRVSELPRPEGLRDHPPAHGRIATWEGDPATGEVRGSSNLAALWGVAEGSRLTIGPLLQRVRSNYRASVEAALRGAIEVGEPVDLEFPLEGQDGDERWLEASLLPVVGPTGRTERWMGAVVDITAHKRAQADLEQEQYDVQSMLDTLPAAALVLDASGAPVVRNAYWRDLTGDATAHDGDDAFVHPDDREVVAARRERGLAQGEPFDSEYRIWDIGRGEHRLHRVRTMPLRDAGGTIYRWLTIAIDVHDQREAQAGLDAASRARDEFIDFVTYELRGPLSNLLEMTGSLQRRVRSTRTEVEELRRPLEELHAHAEHLRDIVEAMVALARVGRGTAEPEPLDTARRRRAELG